MKKSDVRIIIETEGDEPFIVVMKDMEVSVSSEAGLDLVKDENGAEMPRFNGQTRLQLRLWSGCETYEKFKSI